MFINFTAKLGNMRQPQEFVLYPIRPEAPDELVIQSNKRIARINLTTGKGKLSDGKNGHQGFHKLQSIMGAMDIDASAILPDLAPLVAKLKGAQNADGSIVISM